jgi:hypothetical protein
MEAAIIPLFQCGSSCRRAPSPPVSVILPLGLQIPCVCQCYWIDMVSALYLCGATWGATADLQTNCYDSRARPRFPRTVQVGVV